MSESSEPSNTGPFSSRALREAREGSPSSMRSVIETGLGSSTPSGINPRLRHFPARAPTMYDTGHIEPCLPGSFPWETSYVPSPPAFSTAPSQPGVEEFAPGPSEAPASPSPTLNEYTPTDFNHAVRGNKDVDRVPEARYGDNHVGTIRKRRGGGHGGHGGFSFVIAYIIFILVGGWFEVLNVGLQVFTSTGSWMGLELEPGVRRMF
ncbi:hypothetical protein BDP27DRAFT_1429458 [Rhodocollybia butyracea]|uniref:Uncharacterized protein n=1 Tax=Rhodocollybia butyracea TaxID=206335 RepID=A0A9P5U030_9AGAR|nr:hypothetical protein BDP27DRAFT_1429458 [Rhodocollybia butyracea]